MTEYRIEKDSMGEVRVPAGAYYGAQTRRAVENFPVSGQPMPLPVVRAAALIKGLAAEVNAELGLLPPTLAEAISRAAREVLEGRFDEQFVVDVFQTGSGTSTNMNVNEVLSNRANELLGKTWITTWWWRAAWRAGAGRRSGTGCGGKSWRKGVSRTRRTTMA